MYGLLSRWRSSLFRGRGCAGTACAGEGQRPALLSAAESSPPPLTRSFAGAPAPPSPLGAGRWGRRTTLALALCLPLPSLPAAASELAVGPFTITEALGGDTSRPGINRNAFALPAANLTRDETRVFFFGNRLFNTNWVVAPASTDGFDGLGPLFNRVSCSGCHLRDGRGQPPETAAEEMLSMLVRLSLPGQATDGGPLPHPVYGDQLSDRAIPGVLPEGRALIAWEEIAGSYGDGTPYSLRRPQISFVELAYGPLPEEILTSPRVAPAVFGLGLLEAVPAATLEALADPDDADGDGISGRINLVWDQQAGAATLGRFGWKANQPSLLQQSAGAAVGDIGLTTSLFAAENCSAIQADCVAALTGGAPELDDAFLDKLIFYMRTLAVPLARDFADPEVRQGAALFAEIGCAACHTPTLQTGEHPVPAVASQTIHPFTDLLLHDMGPGLADGRPDFLASGSEWRTPPLWGLGLVGLVNGHDRFLHDGRARGLAEAILWHGGEAEAAKERFRALPAEARAALIAFLEAL